MLTLLAPDIVASTLGGRQRTDLGVYVLREGLPAEWREQQLFSAGVVCAGKSLL
ncbi:MAG: hypothetical protein NT133_06775 [Alphaproteobacteria bacterium]|nr:hypothetical protein [Alphaproteobacteria bacterium]